MASLGRHMILTCLKIRTISSPRNLPLQCVQRHFPTFFQLTEATQSFHSCARCLKNSDIPQGSGISRVERNTMVLSKTLFEEASQDSPNKGAFKDVVTTFTELDKRRRGHIQFIETALRYMKAFGVEKDVDAYNKLLDVFPKGKYVAKNAYQSMFNHYPEQQVCGIKVLQQMEDNGVLPNNDTKEILISVFGRKAHPIKKYQRLMYWFPKFRNINPFPLPQEMPSDPIKLSEIGLKRISEYEAEFTVYSFDRSSETSVICQGEDYSDLQGQDYIASVQSPDQKEDLAQHQIFRPLYVEGPYTLWLKTTRQPYYVLRTDPMELQDPIMYDRGQLPPAPREGNVYAMCMTSDGNRAVLSEWINRLQDENPHLARLTVIFNLFDKKGDGQDTQIHHIGEGNKMLGS
ncbi:evolutionarily conserved signaling intermediate in Toll pathway, mitochondrial-like [Lytechinus pictus]|uniref:evolutionarily conserved signaling intermediate in Toll pathway, mitochondrial-like n=1 Tax=Lytechinus pictus TaxID=7653 RepID=UPI0030B9E8B7